MASDVGPRNVSGGSVDPMYMKAVEACKDCGLKQPAKQMEPADFVNYVRKQLTSAQEQLTKLRSAAASEKLQKIERHLLGLTQVAKSGGIDVAQVVKGVKERPLVLGDIIPEISEFLDSEDDDLSQTVGDALHLSNKEKDKLEKSQDFRSSALVELERCLDRANGGAITWPEPKSKKEEVEQAALKAQLSKIEQLNIPPQSRITAKTLQSLAQLMPNLQILNMGKTICVDAEDKYSYQLAKEAMEALALFPKLNRVTLPKEVVRDESAIPALVKFKAAHPGGVRAAGYESIHDNITKLCGEDAILEPNDPRLEAVRTNDHSDDAHADRYAFSYHSNNEGVACWHLYKTGKEKNGNAVFQVDIDSDDNIIAMDREGNEVKYDILLRMLNDICGLGQVDQASHKLSKVK